MSEREQSDAGTTHTLSELYSETREISEEREEDPSSGLLMWCVNCGGQLTSTEEQVVHRFDPGSHFGKERFCGLGCIVEWTDDNRDSLEEVGAL